MPGYNVKSHSDKALAQDEIGFKAKVVKYFKEYSNNTTIHGFKYLVESRSIWERLWWIISIGISLSFCVILVWRTYQKWATTPVIVSFATKETPTWQVPFPAVTICPLTKAVPSKFNFTYYLEQLAKKETISLEAEKKLGYLSLICNIDPRWLNGSDLDFADYHLYEFLDEVQPDFDEMLTECSYMGKAYHCKDLFFPLITDEGLCYTFNLLDRSQLFRDDVVFSGDVHRAPKLSNWTLEHGYHIDDNIDTYPNRALFSGSIFALQGVLTWYEDEEDVRCREGIKGFKIQISNPAVMPRPQQQHILIPLGRAVECVTDLDIIGTSDTVKKYDPHIRGCYYPNERPLKYFKLYSQENCQIECRTNFTMQHCGCIDFYMPRYNDTPICRQGGVDCLFEAQEILLHTIINRQLDIMRGKNNYIPDLIDKCDCLPICTSMKYTVETTQTQWNWQKILPPKNSSRKQDKSFFQVYMKSGQFISSERNELFGITDFLANFGGLLGLFIGFSLLSVIEIVYYLSLRIIENIKIHDSWAGK